MILSKENAELNHINSITHDGKVLVFATSEEGVIYYTVRADGFENNQPTDQNWGNWEELPLPELPPAERETPEQKENGDASVRDFEEEHFTTEDGTHLLRSRYHTKGESVIAPVQLVSDLDYLYVFRQSKTGGYLWVDRFVLDGMNNRLIRKLEVRYKRSKQKYAPLEAPSGKANISFDSLHFRDADGNPFYEPTIELNLQATMANGWFSVVLLPTEILDEHRWHFFFYHSSEGLNYVSVRASAEGLFDLRDRAGQTGYELRNLQLNNSEGKKLTITGPPVATKYDQQAERINQMGETHLVRTLTKVLMVVPTDQGAASVDFSVAADGRLSYLSSETQSLPPVLLSGRSSALQLPPDTLEKIKDYRSVAAPATGRILGMEKAADGRIRLHIGQGDPRPASGQILIKGTQSYNGLYKVDSVNGDYFEIAAALEASDPSELLSDYTIGALDRAVKKGHTTLRVKESLQEAIPAGTLLRVTNGSNEPTAFKTRKETSAGTETIWIEKATATAPVGSIVYNDSTVAVSSIKHELGEWEEAPVASNALTAAGEITHLQASASGKLKINAHQALQAGNDIQIKGSNPADGWYDVLETDEDGIVLDAPWEAGEVINRSLRKYRGIQMPGRGERFAVDMKQKVSVGCVEIRFKTSRKEGVQYFSFHETIVNEHGRRSKKMSVKIELEAGVPVLSLTHHDHDGPVPQQFEKRFPDIIDVADGQWHHLSYVWGKQAHQHGLYLDGKEIDIKIPDLDYPFFHCDTIGFYNESSGQGYESEDQLAELRLWSQPRSPQEIRELLYENLTGREAGLVGYWPMGAIADGRKLLDLSENKNHGFVSGNVYTPGVQLEREDTVIEFSNEALIAVTQGGAYTESFEYRPHGDAPHEEAPFQFKYRGKRSRNADIWTEQEAFNAEQHTHEELADGWRRAACSFVVPEGVSLLRSFGIHQLGQWDRLEVRNHGIRLTSNSISKQVRLEQAGLADLSPNYEEKNQALILAEKKSEEKTKLVNEFLDLKTEHGALIDEASINGRRERLRDEVKRLKEIQQRLLQSYNREKDTLSNYWVRLVDYSDDYGAPNSSQLVLETNRISENHFTLVFKKGDNGDSGKFKFIPSEDNPGYYSVKWKKKDVILQRGISKESFGGGGPEMYNSFVKIIPPSDVDFTDDESELVIFGSIKNIFKIKTIKGDYIGASESKARIYKNKDKGVIFFIDLSNAEHCNTKIAEAEKQYDLYTNRLNRATETLKQWEEKHPPGLTHNEIENRRETVLSRILEITGIDIPAIESQMTSLNQQFKNNVAKANGILPSQLFENGPLVTSGGILNFVQGDSQLHLLPSADGNIRLSYIDQYGQLRQPFYDTVSDSQNTTSKPWVPDSHRFCLRGSKVEEGVTLANPIPLSNEWTLECRFYYPFEEREDVEIGWLGLDNVLNKPRVLFGNKNESAVQIRYSNGRVELGTCFGEKLDYYPCGFDMQELLEEGAGWHHLAVVGKGVGVDTNTYFYIDGEEKGDIKQAALAKLLKMKEEGNTSAINEAQGKVDDLNREGSITTDINAIGIQEFNSKIVPYSNAGKMAEVRVWGVALSPEEIEINSQLSSLSGYEPGLKAYLPLNGDGLDKTGNGYDEQLTESTSDNSDRFVPYTGEIGQFIAPIPSAIISNEYSTVGLDLVTGQKTAMLRRFMAYPKDGGVQLLSQQRIEELELLWIGNAQINPTLLGFIEGAPPVPSENLTVDPPSYQGATSVELVTEKELTFSWNREDTSSLGMNLDLFVGAAATVSFLGLGGVSYKVGVSGGLALANTSFNQSNIGSSASSTNTDRLELRGYPETKAHFPHLGPRFVPKNIGYALVASGTADVYITRLKRSKRMIAYTVQPSPDIPLDINTITFLINPAYTMNGSLDGLTGTRPTSERFFKDVLDMRAQYGSAFPASYYRVEEAYDLKENIEKQDKERAAYFANFDIWDLQGDIDRVTGNEPEDDKETERIAKEKQAEMERRIEDEEARAHAFSAFAAWQRKMEDLQIKAGKRNIVNTYVWDADGGLRVEEQQFAGTIEHTVGGSFELSGALGVSGEVEASGLGVGIGAALTLEATLSMSQTMSKTESSRRALSLSVDLSGVESQGITDFKDNPLMPGEKVDRYRFMSFYLEGSSQHFDDFFNEVVDPEWLAGNDEEARALRQAQKGRPNKTWRVLHRVTYVERPALKGFGKK